MHFKFSNFVRCSRIGPTIAGMIDYPRSRDVFKFRNKW